MNLVYIATSFESAQAARDLAARLPPGWAWSYDWSVHTFDDDPKTVAQEDMHGVARADAVIVLLPGGPGTHTELGIALGQQTPVCVVGDDRQRDRPWEALFSTTGRFCGCWIVRHWQTQTFAVRPTSRYAKPPATMLMAYLRSASAGKGSRAMPKSAVEDVEGILRQWLGVNGFDGLCGDGCGCTLGDFCPCGNVSLGCTPAYDHGPGEYEDGHCDHWMMPTKRGSSR